MTAPLIDTFGRVHTNLRISVTDRCSLRCIYCMPAGEVQFLDRRELLTFEEMVRFTRVAVDLGVRSVRLTGGEPLLRRELPKLVAMLREIPLLEDLGLTTNGLLLAEQAQALFDAGLQRVNISLDALSAEKFEQFTRRTGFEKVLAGIAQAQKVGFDPIKINAVSVRGMTEDELVPFGNFARDTGIEVRFIEYMPLDASNAWQREKVLFASEIVDRLSQEIMPLVAIPAADPHAPATDFVFADGRGRIGFIASVSHPFCSQCDRFRITAEGQMRNCLFSLQETDIRGILRGGGTDADIAAAIRGSIADKHEGHEINTSRFLQPNRPMYSIGG